MYMHKFVCFMLTCVFYVDNKDSKTLNILYVGPKETESIKVEKNNLHRSPVFLCVSDRLTEFLKQYI